MSSAADSTEIVDVGVRGGAIRLEIAGTGTPLVLLHGWALDRRVWELQIGGLSNRFRVIAVDRRGFGESTAPPDLGAEIEDLLLVRNRLGLERMILVGMSQAGRVALQFALAHPDSVCGLILQGAPLDGFLPGPRQEEAIPLSSYMALARAGELERMKRLWRGHPLMRASSPRDRNRLDVLLAGYQGRDLVAPEPRPLAAIAGRLEDVRAPALVVTGGNDTPWRQLVGDALAYGLPLAERAVIAGAQHLCNLTDPKRYNALVAAFAERAQARSAGPP